MDWLGFYREVMMIEPPIGWGEFNKRIDDESFGCV